MIGGGGGGAEVAGRIAGPEPADLGDAGLHVATPFGVAPYRTAERDLLVGVRRSEDVWRRRVTTNP